MSTREAALSFGVSPPGRLRLLPGSQRQLRTFVPCRNASLAHGPADINALAE